MEEKNDSKQLEFDFESVIEEAEVKSRDEVAAQAYAGEDDEQGDFDAESPIDRTSAYMRRSLEVEEAWETTLQDAREELAQTDAKNLYKELIYGLKERIESGDRPGQFSHLLKQVAFRGLGLTHNHLYIREPRRGSEKWQVEIRDEGGIEEHLDSHIVGPNFLNPIDASKGEWSSKNPLIAGSDVSQHRSRVPVPSRYFKRSVPFVLNNAAGTVLRTKDGEVSRYEPLFNPRPDETLLRWMLIDPSYQDELEPEDYQRCIASAMDVGQYKFDLDFLLSDDKHPPEIILRDGSLFPQDAYLSNYQKDNRRGEFTREAIQGLLKCITHARNVGSIYCGVAKNVRLKVYSTALDWYIQKHINPDWEVGGYTLNDGEAMSLLMSSPDFVEQGLERTLRTCLIRRSFTTRANLNTRRDLSDLDNFFEHEQEKFGDEISITPYRRLCEIGHVYMCFLGHSRSPQQRIPRYEFYSRYASDQPKIEAAKILDAIRMAGLHVDRDHSFMADEPIQYLIPHVTQQAHQYSKDVGKHIDRATGAWIMARYKQMIERSNR